MTGVFFRFAFRFFGTINMIDAYVSDAGISGWIIAATLFLLAELDAEFGK